MDESLKADWKAEKLAPEGKGNGLKVFDGFLWICTVIIGVVTGIAGSLTAAVGVMDDYASLYNQWIGMDETITNEEAKRTLEWIMASPWTVYFQSETAKDDFLSTMILVLTALGILFVAGAVLLCVFSGRFHREEDGKIHLNLFDRIWSEVQLAGAVGCAVAAVSLAYPMYEMWPAIQALPSVYAPVEENHYVWGPSNWAIFVLCIAGMTLAIALMLVCTVALAKKLKARRFWEKSLLGKIFGSIGGGISAVVRAIRTSDHFMLKYVGLLIGMVLLAMTWIGAVVDLVLIFLFVPKKVKKLQEIRAGVLEVKDGNLSYKIPVESDEQGSPRSELDMLAADINRISDASEMAIRNELKTQRMKTELISNVSHDLKTPLTSMVSYIDLLEQEGLDSPNAPEYLRILDEKTQRLRVLTENLFEAAKASSGAMPVNMETIDLGSLVSQSLGEMSERLAAQKLDVIVENHCAAVVPQTQVMNGDEPQQAADAPNTAEDSGSTPMAGPRVLADGQLLWRVLENLLGNVSKYAQPDSRVYLDISSVKSKKGKETASDTADGSVSNGFVLLEVKNISRDRLNISADELLERFKRGDESRSTEGSGLGLAIARDLTKLMNGVFEITVDGDLFKASVLLKQG